MGELERPKLRLLPASRFDWDGRAFVRFDDPAGVVPHPVLITFDSYRDVVRHFDGAATLVDHQARLRAEHGLDVPLADLSEIVTRLDDLMVLDGPRFATYLQTYRADQTRPAAFAGKSYPASPRALEGQLNRYYDDPKGAGRPRPGLRTRRKFKRVRAVISPHIDFRRGGPTYTQAYRTLAEAPPAEIYVILGVAHQPCHRRFILTGKDFETPLGPLSTDRAFVRRLVDRVGPSVLDDELAHRTEHSVEFQAVWLRSILGERAATIVPILVGSFHDLMEDRVDPIENAEVAAFVSALREAEEASGKRVIYIGGIDLSHVGPEFGDVQMVSISQRAAIRAHDHTLLDRALAGDARGWFATAAQVQNQTRVCGLAATYTLLHTLGPVRGRLLQYDQAVDPAGECLVSFASALFED